MLVAVRGMHEAPLLVSCVTPEQGLDIAHVQSILRGRPLTRSRSVIHMAMVRRVPSSRAVGVEVLVTLLLEHVLG